tara:strand:- start:28 stop:369 length:342 start_codon:yes stop_codon:yes gene_type:complete
MNSKDKLINTIESIPQTNRVNVLNSLRLGLGSTFLGVVCDLKRIIKCDICEDLGDGFDIKDGILVGDLVSKRDHISNVLKNSGYELNGNELKSIESGCYLNPDCLCRSCHKIY